MVDINDVTCSSFDGIDLGHNVRQIFLAFHCFNDEHKSSTQ